MYQNLLLILMGVQILQLNLKHHQIYSLLLKTFEDLFV